MFKNNLKKNDLVNKLSIATGYSKIFSEKLVTDLVKIIAQNIKSSNFHLKNIGSFKLINKKERIGRNPKTKEEFTIIPRKQISFTPSRKIARSLNKLI